MLALGCSPDEDTSSPECIAGQRLVCDCPDGQSGFQDCTDGSLEACQCPATAMPPPPMAQPSPSSLTEIDESDGAVDGSAGASGGTDDQVGSTADEDSDMDSPSPFVTPQSGGQESGPCRDGMMETQGCDDEGEETRTCVDGVWSDWGPCLAECDDEEPSGQGCGINLRGNQSRECVDGYWGPWGPCMDSDVCSDGGIRSNPPAPGSENEGDTTLLGCGLNARGIQWQMCARGQWPLSWGPCEDPDVCVDGTLEDRECGTNGAGRVSRACIEGQWAEGQACDDPDTCLNGEIRTESCCVDGSSVAAGSCDDGSSGTQSRECVDGQWSTPGPCIDPEAPCTSGIRPCGLNGRGTQNVRCTNGRPQLEVCNDIDECIDGSEQVAFCEQGNGSQTRVCANGMWGNWQGCMAGARCREGAIQTELCRSGYPRRRVCEPEGVAMELAWSEWSECAVCFEGEIESEACPDGGETQRLCRNGVWTDWSSCVGCEEGTIEEEMCPGEGSRTRQCLMGRWQSWTACARNGRCIQVEPMSIDFGSVAQGGVYSEQVTLKSCGNDSVRIDGIYLLDSSDPVFSLPADGVPGPLPVNLPPAPAQTTITIEYQPQQIGENQGALMIWTNGSKRPPDPLPITARSFNNECPIPVGLITAVDGTALVNGSAGEVQVGPLQTVTLDSSSSSNPNQSGSLTHEWVIVERPDGSTTQPLEFFNDPSRPSSGGRADDTRTSTAEFFVDLAGRYILELRVTNSFGATTPSAECPQDTPTRVVIDATPDQDIHVQLVWDTPSDMDQTDGSGSDVDLHLIHPSGFSGDPTSGGSWWTDIGWTGSTACYYGNINPDWGIFGDETDDPSLDIDDTNGAGPENINLDGPEETSAYGPHGAYRVGAYYYRDRGLSTATLRIYIGGEIRFDDSRRLPSTGEIWYAADIYWENNLGRVVPTTVPVYTR